jgi:hypothetical protein
VLHIDTKDHDNRYLVAHFWNSNKVECDAANSQIALAAL